MYALCPGVDDGCFWGQRVAPGKKMNRHDSTILLANDVYSVIQPPSPGGSGAGPAAVGTKAGVYPVIRN